MARALIIGYGSELRGDDRVGPALAEMLAADDAMASRLAAHEVEILARPQLTPELAVDASEVEQLILVDASVELRPGEIGVQPVEAAGVDAAASSHHMGALELLGLTRALYGRAPRTWLVSVGVGTIEPGERLSTAVSAALPQAAAKVRELIDA
jgi:hydrogenase maturation protease